MILDLHPPEKSSGKNYDLRFRRCNFLITFHWKFSTAQCVLHTPSAIAGTPLSRGDLGAYNQIILKSYFYVP